MLMDVDDDREITKEELTKALKKWHVPPRELFLQAAPSALGCRPPKPGRSASNSLDARLRIAPIGTVSQNGYARAGVGEAGTRGAVENRISLVRAVPERLSRIAGRVPARCR